jgi:putative ABC transport system permease protein
MIHSFRGTVDAWIASALTADLYAGSAANEIAPAQADLPPEAVAWLRAQPGVRNVATFSELPLAFRGERTAMGVVSGKPEAEIRFLGGGGRAKYQRFLEPGAVIVSEPFANRFGVSEGERLRIPTPRGDAEFAVAGIHQDYARNGGILLITRGNYERLWGESGVQSVALTLDPGADAAGLGAQFRERFGRDGALVVYSNRALRERIFEIFDQTFAVTLVLRGIAIVVAAAGVLLALLILTAEREREIGVMRAVGASPWQVMGLFLREAALIGMIASVVGVASGACLAVVLTFVVNKAYFGWTIDLSWPFGLLVATPLWIVPVAIAAALLPAWRAAQIPPAAALRLE